MKLEVKTLEGSTSGHVDLNETLFCIEPRVDLIHRCVRWQLAKRRASSRATKGRSEIDRTKKKLYKQKGTGHARHGAASAPQFRGGGKAFGPVARDFEHSLPKKIRKLALRHVIALKIKTNNFYVLEDIQLLDKKTKDLSIKLNGLGLTDALLVGGSTLDFNFCCASRGLKKIDVLPIQGANVYDILRREKLVLTRSAIDVLEARYT